MRLACLAFSGLPAADMRHVTFGELCRGERCARALRRRRAAFGAESARARLPNVLLSDGRFLFAADADLDASPEPESESVLRGVGVSFGVAEGVVRVVREPARAGALPPDCVLVAPATDPAWTPLFLGVRALVTETGGQLTDGAVVCRELGKPGVVAGALATASWIVGSGFGFGFGF